MRWVLMLVVAMCGGCGGKQEPVGTAEPAPPLPEPELTVTAEQLFRDYGEHTPAVDQKYRGKILKVRGKVHAVEQEGGGFLVGMQTGPNVVASTVERKAAVVGVFPAAAKDAVAPLKELDDIVLIGKCTGRQTDEGRKGGIKIALADCRIEAHFPR